jgi:hypothetical protein
MSKSQSRHVIQIIVKLVKLTYTRCSGRTLLSDFRCSTATTHLQWFQRKTYVSEQLWNSIPNSCSSECPGASIYRLGPQMSVRQNIAGRRSDGGHGPSGRTTVRQDFLKISLRNLSCLRATFGRDGTSSGRSYVRCK